MAEEIVCPACETVNAASNETCVACGADLRSQMPVEHDDPSMADTPAAGSEFSEDEVDFEDAEDYAAQDVHDNPGDVEIEGSPSEQLINEESGDDFDGDDFADFGDPASVDEGDFPLDDDEFGEEADLYEGGAAEQEVESLGVAEGDESEAAELAQEAADEYVDDEFEEFEEFDDESDPYGEFDEDEQVDAEFADFEDDAEDDFEDLADEASDELEQDEFADFDEADDFDETSSRGRRLRRGCPRGTLGVGTRRATGAGGHPEPATRGCRGPGRPSQAGAPQRTRYPDALRRPQTRRRPRCLGEYPHARPTAGHRRFGRRGRRGYK